MAKKIMGIFSPVKKHANKFRYIPRYYDPEKERREQRRRELCGTSSADDAEYTPGQYIRTQRDARRVAKSANSDKKRIPRVALVMLLITAVIVVTMLVPRIVAIMSMPKTVVSDSVVVEKEQEFNPYAPITIVPNDYKGEE